MLQVDNLRPVHNTQGLRHYDSSNTNPSNTSPPAFTHTGRPNLTATGEIQRNNTLVHWNHAPITSSHAPITSSHAPITSNHAPITSSDNQTTNYDKQSPPISDDEDDDDDEYRPFTPPPPRERLSYTRYQLELLSGIYDKVRYPNSTQKQLIAKRVGITREQVKIWFQNRRRKDVINNPKQTDKDKGEEPNSPRDSTTSEGESGTTSDSSDKSAPSPSDADGIKMVPNIVLKSVIKELVKFEKTVIKAKKTKKKSRQKQQQQQQQKQLQQRLSAAAATVNATVNVPTAAAPNAATKSKALSMFNAYDMISPPNRVITSGFLDTTLNRFTHSKSTSAFQDPKNTMETHTSPSSVHSMVAGGYPHGPSNITCLPNEYNSLHSNGMTSQINNQLKAHSVFENIPVLADLLGYRGGDSVRSSHNPYTSPSGNHDRTFSDIPGSMNHGSLGVNRVFPFPFIADAPVMLSSVRHPDPYRPPVHFLPPQHPEDPYQPFMISSYSNPYYSATAAHVPAQTWPPQQAAPSTDNTYTAPPPGAVL